MQARDKKLPRAIDESQPFLTSFELGDVLCYGTHGLGYQGDGRIMSKPRGNKF